jgi:hypothetical protein
MWRVQRRLAHLGLVALAGLRANERLWRIPVPRRGFCSRQHHLRCIELDALANHLLFSRTLVKPRPEKYSALQK